MACRTNFAAPLTFLAIGLLFAATIGVGPHAPPARAIDDPSIDYKTIRTPHFQVHYGERWRGFAWRVARVAEEAHRMLVPLLETKPTRRTHIVINDKIDTSNGSANVLGRNVIRLFAAPPRPDSTLGYYDDWLRILVYHEYVHVLHLDTLGLAGKIINTVIGKRVHPNAVLPTWYIEGLATMHESTRTGTGRVNSSLFRMWMRTAAESDSFFSLGTASGTPISWPQGTTPYLYGSFFLNYIDETYGLTTTTDFIHTYAGRLLPFSINKTLRDVTGKTFHELWKEWAAYEKAKAQAKRVAVNARGRTPIDQLTDEGNEHRFPRMRPGSNAVSYYSSGLNSDDVIAQTTPTSPDDATPLVNIDGLVGPTDWGPDGRRLYLIRQQFHRTVYRYADIYVWVADGPESTDGQLKRVTDADRVQDLAVSPSGERIAFVRNRRGTMELVDCKLQGDSLDACTTVAGGTSHPADEERHWQQFSGLDWSPDGRALVFSWWRLDERQRDLWVWRPSAGGERRDDADDSQPAAEPTRLTRSAAYELQPAFGPDGMLYYASDRTDIYNIYARKWPEGPTYRVSNVTTGMFDPRITDDSKWIYASTYTADGYELTRLRRPERFDDPIEAASSQIARRNYPEIDTSSFETSNYSPGQWLAPTLMMPNVGAFTSAGGGAGLTLTGGGPVGHHQWNLNTTWLTGPELTDYRFNVGLNYTYGQLPFDVTTSLQYREYPQTRELFAESRFIPYIESEYGGRVSLRIPVADIEQRVSASPSVSVNRTTFATQPDLEPEPADLEPRFPERDTIGRLGLRFTYSDLEGYRQAISIADGVSAYFNGNVGTSLVDGAFQDFRLSYGLRFWEPHPLFDRHFLHLRMDGGVGQRAGGRPAFGIGGYTPQDVLTDVILQQPRGQFVLRGFPPGHLVGDQFQVWTGEWRFPLARIESGLSTVPMFLQRLKGSVFADAGTAFFGHIEPRDIRASVGAELQLGLLAGYNLSSNLRLGIARGIGEQGRTQAYFLYGGGY